MSWVDTSESTWCHPSYLLLEHKHQCSLAASKDFDQPSSAAVLSCLVGEILYSKGKRRLLPFPSSVASIADVSGASVYFLYVR